MVPVLLPAPALELPVRRLIALLTSVSSLWRAASPPTCRLTLSAAGCADEAHTERAARWQRPVCTRTVRALRTARTARLHWMRGGESHVSLVSWRQPLHASAWHSRDGPYAWLLGTLAHDAVSFAGRRCVSLGGRTSSPCRRRLPGGTWLQSHRAMPPQVSSTCGKPPAAAWSVRTPAGGQKKGRGGGSAAQHGWGWRRGLCRAGARRCRRWRMMRAVVTRWSGQSHSGCAAPPAQVREWNPLLLSMQAPHRENPLSDHLYKGVLRSYAPTPSRARIIEPAALNREFAAQTHVGVSVRSTLGEPGDR